MRTLEHRRHSQRDPAGIHLNPAGRALAQRVGAGLAPFDRVVTSPKPRARETAEAMGCIVDAEAPSLGEMPDDVGLPIDEMLPRTFADYVSFVRRSEPIAAYARAQADQWRVELERLPERGSLLMISHGGIIELGAAAALPGAAATWGATLGYLEGVRLVWDGRRWMSGEVLRVAPTEGARTRAPPRAPGKRPRPGSP
jgi:broad specificity phosphatase PhoE